MEFVVGAPVILSGRIGGRNRSTRRLRYARQRADSRIAFAASNLDPERGAMLSLEGMVAHFCAQVVEGRQVKIRSLGEQYEGRLGFPDFERMVIPFFVDTSKRERTTQPRVSSVELHTHNDEGKFGFNVNLIGRDSDACWLLSFPRNQVFTEVRMTSRHMVDESWNFRPRNVAGWDGPQSVSVRDLSCGGMSLVLPDLTNMRRLKGRIISGTLEGERHVRLPIRIKVSSVREVAGFSNRLVAGGGFNNIGFAQYTRLASVLSKGLSLVEAA